MEDLLGRQYEKGFLKKIADSNKPAFVAVYGRRRVGKTFLIKKYFNHSFTFYATGIANGNTKKQLMNFIIFVNKSFDKEHPTPPNWIQAFIVLQDELKKVKGNKIIFIDELPWMDTKKSDFIAGLERFWNSWASTQKGLKLIVCGSAASWMIKKLIRNTKGLHNRVTHRLKIEPFTLLETEQYLQAHNINWDRYQIVNLYMVIGGIPYYLEQIEKGKSVDQNIENLCFSSTGLLKEEFQFIFKSLFNNSEKHEAILQAIHALGNRCTRIDLLKKLKMVSNSGISIKLKELEESGFIKSYVPIGLNTSKRIYIISDYFSLFYFKFVSNTGNASNGNWLNRISDSAIASWRGLMFEQVCWDHTKFIKRKLGIEGVFSQTSTWQQQGTANTKGAQIDLVLDRQDRIINLFEIKYSINTYTITKAYDLQLRNKIAVFKEATKTRKTIFLTMVTSFGLTENEYRHSVVQNSLTIDDLFG